MDQQRAVGAFLSLGVAKPNLVEVGPTRIRAYNGEDIIWTIRNPSKTDIDIELYQVEHVPGGVVPLGTVFSSTGGRARIPKNCGIGFLQARLHKNLVSSEGSRADSCVAETFNYTFMLYTGAATGGNKPDSILCTWPYDPELVVEGKP
jgi:hypothetical protein